MGAAFGGKPTLGAKSAQLGRFACAAAVSAWVLVLGTCTKDYVPSDMVTLRITYERVSVPCPGCPDEPWVYILWGNADRVITGGLHKAGPNYFEGTIKAPSETYIQVNINDARMYDGVNVCSYMKVGERLTANGYPLRISSHDCAASYSGWVVIIVHLDGTIENKGEEVGGGAARIQK